MRWRQDLQVKLFWSCTSPHFWSWLSQHVHLGDLPTWLAAVGALIAARFALGQLRTMRRELRATGN
jgi:hypothetical protein